MRSSRYLSVVLSLLVLFVVSACGSDDDDSPEPAAGAGATPRQDDRNALSSILPSYKGSMWTAGLTIYF